MPPRTPPRASLSLLLALCACGEIEEIKTQGDYGDEAFRVVIEPIFKSFSQTERPCESCHAAPQGGFRWNPSGTPAASNDNLLSVQRAMNSYAPAASPLLTRLTPPSSGHDLYFCRTDTHYLRIIAWASGEANSGALKEITGTTPTGALTTPESCP